MHSFFDPNRAAGSELYFRSFIAFFETLLSQGLIGNMLLRDHVGMLINLFTD